MSPAVATAALPTRSQIQGWSISHLTAGAAEWETTADKTEKVFAQHVESVRAPGGTEWAGFAADSAYDTARGAQDAVRAQVAIERDCVQIARRGADDILAMKRAVLDAIADAEAKGFVVAEDLSVIDTKKVSIDSSEFFDRKIEARQLSEFVRWRAEHLMQTEVRVALELTAKATELGSHTIAEGGGTQMLGAGQLPEERIPGDLFVPPELSDARKKAIEYAETWANGYNGDYRRYDQDCTNFVSQALRAGGIQDRGDDLGDWNHGDRDDWYYNKGTWNPKNVESETWYNAAASHDYFTQHSGLGEIKGVVGTPGPSGYDPLAPSKAGLVPGDLIYYKNNEGTIDHVAMYVGNIGGVDVVDQHADPRNAHDDWWPNTNDFLGGPARVEFVHIIYPGDKN